MGFCTGDQELRPGKLSQMTHPSDMGRAKEGKKDSDLRKVAA